MAKKLGKSKGGGAGATGPREAKRLEKAIARATSKVAKRRSQLDEASTVLAELEKRRPTVAKSASEAPAPPNGAMPPVSDDVDADAAS